ncbi:MAG: helix-turn-helix transcriptional regulator [Erysipelotrichaceae bacterium]|nr:helix-turn-helix transcriptional regulator [Erysipelotrichaceae bacterium]
MEIKEACEFLSDISGLPIEMIETEKDLSAFCKKHLFHQRQDHFTLPYLKTLLKEIKDDTVLFMCDLLLIRYVIIKTKEKLIFVGPYITQDMTLANIELLKQNNAIPDLPNRDFQAYRNHYMLKDENEVARNCSILLKNCGYDPKNFSYEYNYSESEQENKSWEYSHRNYEILINERYRIEQEMMEQIAEGDDEGAVASYRLLHNNVRYMVNYGTTPNDSRISSGITRATVRIAAVNAGLPPFVIDEISGESSNRIRKLNSREEMYSENERMIRRFAKAIMKYREGSHSTPVFNAIFYFDRHYRENISIENTAMRLGVSSSTLINNFKKELGKTPSAYLLELRINKAKRLLRSTQYSIQQIAESVGIYDANYFVKCFRKINDTTPSAYREGYIEKKKAH